MPIGRSKSRNRQFTPIDIYDINFWIGREDIFTFAEKKGKLDMLRQISLGYKYELGGSHPYIPPPPGAITCRGFHGKRATYIIFHESQVNIIISQARTWTLTNCYAVSNTANHSGSGVRLRNRSGKCSRSWHSPFPTHLHFRYLQPGLPRETAEIAPRPTTNVNDGESFRARLREAATNLQAYVQFMHVDNVRFGIAQLKHFAISEFRFCENACVRRSWSDF